MEYDKSSYGSKCIRREMKWTGRKKLTWWPPLNILMYIVQIGWWALMHKTVTNENRLCHLSFYCITTFIIGVPTAVVFFTSLKDLDAVFIISFLIRFIVTIPMAAAFIFFL